MKDGHDENSESLLIGLCFNQIHRSFYEAYDECLQRLLQDSIPSKPPNLKQIVPRVLKRPLTRAVIAFSGHIPKNVSVRSSQISAMAVSMGAEVREEVSEGVTHLIAARADTGKVRRARKLHHIQVVTLEWLKSCFEGWRWADETLFNLKDTPEMIKKQIAKQEVKRAKEARKLRKAAKRAQPSDFDTSSGESCDYARIDMIAAKYASRSSCGLELNSSIEQLVSDGFGY